MPEKRPSLLTWLPRLYRDFRRDLLRNSFWGHSLQKVSNLWGDWGQKIGFRFSLLLSHPHNLIRQWTVMTLCA